MSRLELFCFLGFYAVIAAYLMVGAYHFGHYQGIMANVDAATRDARREAFFEGVGAGADWEANKKSLSCGGA